MGVSLNWAHNNFESELHGHKATEILAPVTIGFAIYTACKCPKHISHFSFLLGGCTYALCTISYCSHIYCIYQDLKCILEVINPETDPYVTIFYNSHTRKGSSIL